MSDIEEPDDAGTGPDAGSDDGCAKCQEARSLTIADQQAVVTHGMTPKPAHEHCHRCDAVARADEPGICPACALPTEGTSESGSAELTCLMADADPTDTKEPNSKFGWSILPDGTGVRVHVQGVHKATVTPDAVNRRFNAEFAADTGLNGSPAARAQMNAYMRKTEPESAEELARQLKEARKGYRMQSSDKKGGWRLVESDHLEYARHVIAAFFVAHRAVSTEVVSDLPTRELQRKVENQASNDSNLSSTPAPTAQWLQRRQ